MITASPIGNVETEVEDFWQQFQISKDEIDMVRQGVIEHINVARTLNDREVKRQTTRITTLDGQATKLLHEHYAESIPAQLFRSEQLRIANEREQAEKVWLPARCNTTRSKPNSTMHWLASKTAPGPTKTATNAYGEK